MITLLNILNFFVVMTIGIICSVFAIVILLIMGIMAVLFNPISLAIILGIVVVLQLVGVL